MQPPPASSHRFTSIALLGGVTLALLLLTSLLSAGMGTWDADLAFSHLWWHAPKVWFGEHSTVCWFLNEFGPLPGVMLAVGALLTFLSALFRRQMRHLAPAALYLMLAFLIGPSLLVNGVLKHTWSRSRPKEIVEFGKRAPYERIFTHVEGSAGRSFPSGHASAAFFVCSLGFASAVWGTRAGVWAGMATGLAWGTLVGWSRIASGAHFLSDVLWSAVLVNAVNFFALLPFLVRSPHGPRRKSVPVTATRMAKYS